MGGQAKWRAQRRRGLYRFDANRWAQPEDFDHQRAVILLHGFTADGDYLRTIGEFLEACGYRALTFEYNSLPGIEYAAKSFAECLSGFDGLSNCLLSRNRVLLVCHDMGGLVARAVVLRAHIRPLVRGMVMLGTPNDGCFPHDLMLGFLVEYGHHIAGPLLGAQAESSMSAKQLTKRDRDGAKPYIDQLNDQWLNTSDWVPCLSVSGGMPHLEVFKSPRRNRIANRAIQMFIGHSRNDGLVAESSVDMHAFMGDEAGGDRYRHLNSYTDYPDVNHTDLKENQSVAIEVVQWLNQR
jgi:pimeloyl-ACP methyl ester carboxylesterase